MSQPFQRGISGAYDSAVPFPGIHPLGTPTQAQNDLLHFYLLQRYL